MARHFADHGIRWAAIATVWFDHPKGGQPRKVWMNRPVDVLRLAEQLSLHEVKPHIWGYPWHGRIQEFLDCTSACLDGTVVGVLPDPELGLKGFPGDAHELFLGLRHLNPYLMLGMTSYGFPRGHHLFPWEEWAEPGVTGDWQLDADYGSPQLYDQSKTKVKDGIKQWIDLGFDAICPSYGVYKVIKKDGKTSYRSMSPTELRSHLRAFTESGHNLPAAIGWAENLVAADCWPVIAEFAERFPVAARPWYSPRRGDSCRS